MFAHHNNERNSTRLSRLVGVGIADARLKIAIRVVKCP
jgi:hypothetical protein